PSPVLFTSLLPMNPAIKPNTIHARIDILCSPCRLPLVLLRRRHCSKFGGPRRPPYSEATTRSDSTLRQPCYMHLSRAALPSCCKHPLTKMPLATVPQTTPSHPCPRSSE